MFMNRKLTYRYVFTLLNIKHAEGRNEYIDLAQKANLLGIKFLVKKVKTRSKQPEVPSSFIKNNYSSENRAFFKITFLSKSN